MKVLHVVESFDGQATELWLTRLASRPGLVAADVTWDFFCTLPHVGRLESDPALARSRVFHSRAPLARPLRHLAHLRSVIADGGYDIIHTHHDLTGTLHLAASVGLGLRKRVLHVHNTASALPTPNRAKVALLRPLLRGLCAFLADAIVGVSRPALDSLVRGRRDLRRKATVIHCSIDVEAVEKALTTRSRAELKRDFRASLDIAPESRIILFAGRLNAYKNPLFVLDVLQRCRATGCDVVAVFAGEGPLTTEIQAVATSRGLASEIRTVGWVDDLLGAMLACDVLLSPSLETPPEGLGLVAVEAQACGLPVLASQSTPTEAVIVPDLFKQLPLDSGADAWAEAVLEILSAVTPSAEECLAAVSRSSFSPAASLEGLLAVYA